MIQEIPSKLYFKIGEVASLVGVKPYVLRYWQTEFSQIAPVKSKANQRLYRRKDVEVLLKIRTLLYEQGFTIEGARKKLKEWGGRNGEGREQLPLELTDGKGREKFRRLRRDLEGLLKILES